MKKIYVLNGPNLNLLGQREPEIYGRITLDQIRGWCEDDAAELGLEVVFRQSNFEGEIIQWIHEARTDAAGIVINPAGYTFTSIAILDALKTFDGPKIELHISNVHQREEIYHKSLVSRTATAVMAGFGAFGYRLALRAMKEWTQ
ncbi:type II 3-dehydroquinate dehydratase [Paracoccus shandongensis]|uniref:type II 3-dehydroquinate dehydratase n=1 Tax=Paracoccus shandongensis TaxID=2816048 RepID=UPI001A8D86E4|nr:type II 3-dehydroquinate dehydratase [Paracoccus shandongensis]